MSLVLGGLDIATATGAAIMRDGVITTEPLIYPGRKKKSILDVDKNKLDAEELGKVFAWFEGAIMTWLIFNKVEYVGIEEPLRTDFSPRKKAVIDVESEWAGKAIRYEEQGGGTSLKTVFKLHGLEAEACKCCAKLNIPVVFVNQSTWRKSFLGNGRPPNAKQAAKKQCERLGIKSATLDSAEAAGVVHWLDQHLNPYSHRRANDLFAGKPSISVAEYKAEAEKLFKTA